MYSSLTGMLVHHRVTPQKQIHMYLYIQPGQERHNENRDLSHELNAKTPTRTQTRTTWRTALWSSMQ